MIRIQFTMKNQQKILICFTEEEKASVGSYRIYCVSKMASNVRTTHTNSGQGINNFINGNKWQTQNNQENN